MYKTNHFISIGIICISLLITISIHAQGRLYAPEGVDGETYFAPFSVNIILDGEFDDWARVPQVYMDAGVGGSAISFASAADDEFLYLYANIVDDNIISGEHAENYWNEDSIEFYLNTTDDLSRTDYTDGVVQMTIPALNRNLPPEEIIISGVRGNTANATAYTTETNQGWAVELSVPLENDVWKIVPEQDTEIGFQVHLNSASDLNRDKKLVWSIFDTGDLSHQNPSVFGRLIFHDISTETTASGEYVFSSQIDENGLLDDFENGIWLDEADDTLIGYVPSSDASLAIQQVTRGSSLALPDQNDIADNILAITGEFTHQFTDSLSTLSLDWSAYNAIGMWLYGQNTERTISVGIDDAVTELQDDFDGWQYVIIPFAQFDKAPCSEYCKFIQCFVSCDGLHQ